MQVTPKVALVDRRLGLDIRRTCCSNIKTLLNWNWNTIRCDDIPNPKLDSLRSASVRSVTNGVRVHMWIHDCRLIALAKRSPRLTICITYDCVTWTFQDFSWRVINYLPLIGHDVEPSHFNTSTVCVCIIRRSKRENPHHWTFPTVDTMHTWYELTKILKLHNPGFDCISLRERKYMRHYGPQVSNLVQPLKL